MMGLQKCEKHNFYFDGLECDLCLYERMLLMSNEELMKYPAAGIVRLKEFYESIMNKK